MLPCSPVLFYHFATPPVQNGVGPYTLQHFGSLTWLMIAASHGVTQGVSWYCRAEHTEFGVCTHVCFAGAVHEFDKVI
eukprot:1140110-Pelagomonas_calceolata.AAC.1